MTINKINLCEEDLCKKVWRYVNFSGLVSLLETSALHFSHVSVFEDKYEGIFNCLGNNDHYDITDEGNIVRFDPADGDLRAMTNSISIKGIFGQYHHAILDATGVNCWRIADNESHAMWRIFLNSDDGVLIVSTLEHLLKSLSEGAHKMTVGKVRYINYADEKMTMDNVTNAFFCKSQHFEHEQELRIICYATDDKADGVKRFKPLPKGGLQVPVDVTELIDAIHISPYAQHWLGELVKLVMKRYSINVPILPSGIALKEKVFG